ncbi:TGS domain-containing protein [Nanobdella aerobiophila]|uniref:TGS domain-containing protein n=1 Tax=Nanobdella aerobiophila TaxID=2586965 RepID=A0A915SY96_9ARCH|nr:GTPase [Nanobdella aerobiophila]BBL45635.1 TGS domain-containing protein [Nanobdella aerobiophila]
MVTNAGAEFYAAKNKFESARTNEERLKYLYEMLKYAPKHKGSEHLIAWINKKISEYESLLEESKNKKGNKGIKLIEKNGDILISILGVENSGKSYFLKKFTNANVDVNDIPYSTTNPIVGTLFYNCIYYQFVEIPATFERRFRNILSLSDYYIIILNKNNVEEQLSRINQFTEGIIKLNKYDNKEYTIIYNDYNDFNNIKIDQILEEIIKKLDYIRVKPVGSEHCVLLNKDAIIKDFIKKLNENWIDKFIYAKIYRNNKYTRGGLNYKLEDKDIVELKLKL